MEYKVTMVLRVESDINIKADSKQDATGKIHSLSIGDFLDNENKLLFCESLEVAELHRPQKKK